jgi:hypothetical protein
MIEQAHTDQRELRIDTEEGLREFLAHTKELYAALLDVAEAKGVGDETVTAKLKQAETAFHHASDVTEMSLRSLALGIPLNDVLVSEIQDRYNDIATIYDLFTIELHKTDTPEVPVITTLEQSNTFVSAVTTLSEKAKALLSRYEEIAHMPVKDGELSVGKFYYNQLVAAEKEISIISDTIIEQKELLETSLVLQENVLKALQDIDTKLNSLDKELDRFFEPDEPPVINNQLIPEKQVRTTEFSPILDQVLLDERYAAFVEETFHSRNQLELKLRREVAHIEAPSKFDMLLGVRHQSAFAFLKDFTIAELIEFDRAPRVVIRGELQAKDIPYEDYVEWMYILHDIHMVFQPPEFVTFGELFVRAELELLLSERIESEV